MIDLKNTQPFESPIYVTRASVCSLDSYCQYLTNVWESGIFTHNGPKVQLLEKKVDEYLGTDTTVAVTNGTIAMQIALRALDITDGEVITTPFSWIATCSAILWEKCVPVFVDADPNTFNIDPEKIERVITKHTKAILAVHVFSNPCAVEKIEEIAQKYELKVIYDGAHAFGVKYKNKSIFEWGDISTTSFHATKLFNTGEGGAVFAKGELKERVKSMRFFGHDPHKQIIDIGCNGKMTEVHACLGLANLPLTDSVIEKRKAISNTYKKILGDSVQFQRFVPNSYNYSYMPILLKTPEACLRIVETLRHFNVFPRRYFYPSLNTISSVKQYTPCPISENLSSRILCLPSYNNLSLEDVQKIANLILAILHDKG
ncbi:DegT/DnrJ/EryC1/StrS family aminotransferase [Limnospira platensis CENA597]|uniref:DegT/DnrJ/EryC1/StrS family aminotransferase n=2 Tax=Limnospira platensis TaxID=118562 RepID=UPI003DA1A065